jgi:hypothetical protein
MLQLVDHLLPERASGADGDASASH